MSTKYEIIKINRAEITVDVSLLMKTEEMFFNATQMARPFGKRPNDFWNDKQNVEYLEALITISGCNKNFKGEDSTLLKQKQNKKYLNALITLSGGNKNPFVQTKKGRYGGTYFHNDLALQFARWLDPFFGVKLDKWVMARLKQEQEWKRSLSGDGVMTFTGQWFGVVVE